MRRYVLRLLGHGDRLVSTRYHLSYQAIDRMAAVSIPQAEMRRLFLEYNGNTQALLAPMSEALLARGYDTLMVVPAQTQVVELLEVPSYEGSPTWEQVFDDASRLEVESAKLMLEVAHTLERLSVFLRSTLSREEAAAMSPHVEGLAARLAAAYGTKG